MTEKIVLAFFPCFSLSRFFMKGNGAKIKGADANQDKQEEKKGSSFSFIIWEENVVIKRPSPIQRNEKIMEKTLVKVTKNSPWTIAFVYTFVYALSRLQNTSESETFSPSMLFGKK